jgi:hypothetical protein
MCEWAPYAATLGLQRYEVLEWLKGGGRIAFFQRLRLHAAHLRLPLAPAQFGLNQRE